MTQDIGDRCKINSRMCKSCPFRDGGLHLSPEKMTEIYLYLIEGVNHFCHSDRTNNTICRGGRNYQIEIWARIGRISAPTDEALAEAMRKAGIEPKGHI